MMRKTSQQPLPRNPNLIYSHRSHVNVVHNGKVPSWEKFRRMACNTMVMSGACGYSDTCVFLHDPRLQVKDIAITKSVGKPLKGNKNKDSWYWPDMNPELVLNTREPTCLSLPCCTQPYMIPQEFADSNRNAHDRGLYSMWNHFIAYIGSVSTQDTSIGRYLNHTVEPCRRLPIFVQLAYHQNEHENPMQLQHVAPPMLNLMPCTEELLLRQSCDTAVCGMTGARAGYAGGQETSEVHFGSLNLRHTISTTRCPQPQPSKVFNDRASILSQIAVNSSPDTSCAESDVESDLVDAERDLGPDWFSDQALQFYVNSAHDKDLGTEDGSKYIHLDECASTEMLAQKLLQCPGWYRNDTKMIV